MQPDKTRGGQEIQPRRPDILWRNHGLALGLVLSAAGAAHAQNLDEIGVTLLRAMTTNLNGAGIQVAQTEAEVSTNPPAFEVNPANVGRAASLFTYYYSASSSSSSYPNSFGTNSWHAEAVANNFYGQPGGTATNVAHVGNYEASYFYNSIINAQSPANINAVIANQSFIFSSLTVSQQQQIDSAYDNYAVEYNTLFVSGAGNSGTVNAPSTAYNGISVGVSDATSSEGPTADNGRCKPDLMAPGGATSFSTPYVAGAAALLMQAALRGDGGNTNAAADLRTIKALLLNGAVKPAGWTNSKSTPLDWRYGAGVVNVFNAYKQLTGGKHGYVVSQSVTNGLAHPPTGATGTVAVLSGWDFNTNTSSPVEAKTSATDGVNHYYFNVTNDLNNAPLVATLTLAWNRPRSASSQVQASLNNLNLFLYNAANSNLVMQSTSLVDNVEHIFVPSLPPGRYDVQVWKAGGSGIVSTAESYALAWAFTAPVLSLARSGMQTTLTWPAYPAGYTIEASSDLVAQTWSTNHLPAPTLAAGTNAMTVSMTNSAQFFRLIAPNF